MSRPAHALMVTLAAAMAAGSAFSVAPVGAQPQSQSRSHELGVLWQRAMDGLSRASDEIEPPLVAPEPIPVHWRARRAASLDLGAPLVALEAGDVDGDGRAELIALTTREVIVMHWPSPRKPVVSARAALPDEPALRWPRDPAGALVVADTDGDGRAEIAARSSQQARGAVFRYRDGAVIELARFAGFPICPGLVAELAPGRNRFFGAPVPMSAPPPGDTPPDDTPPGDTPPGGDSAATAPRSARPVAPPDPAAALLPLLGAGDTARGWFTARCRHDRVDPAGRALAVAAVVDVRGAVRLRAERRCPRRAAGPCAPHAEATTGAHGDAIALGDVDRDGGIEVALTAATPPGEPDRITVLTWTQDGLTSAYTRSFSGGVVGLAAGDVDGDGGDDLVAAIRLWGSHRIDLWTFDN